MWPLHDTICAESVLECAPHAYQLTLLQEQLQPTYQPTAPEVPGVSQRPGDSPGFTCVVQMRGGPCISLLLVLLGGENTGSGKGKMDWRLQAVVHLWNFLVCIRGVISTTVSGFAEGTFDQGEQTGSG
ncbi:hypothetical protein H920_16294 [Fukomys damarensis]|uniref:Uncharacterized protein n=1 Tax=Fukomys damarensis TaxID=885580 RepID=A0A091CVW6_FUKDA|nr:hypothetical protein H920_16294 [Fukomys damarensis]